MLPAPEPVIIIIVYYCYCLLFIEPVGQNTAVAALVGLAALLNAKEHHSLGAVCPELEPFHVSQRNVASEPGDGGGGVPKHLQLDIRILLLICQELVLTVLGELGSASQAPGLQRSVGPD